MGEEHVDQQFEHIVQGLNMPDIEQVDDNSIRLWDLMRAVAGMNEASGYLGQFSLMFIEDQSHEFPTKAIPIVKKLIMFSEMLSRSMAECECSECTICEDCLILEDICDACREDG